MNKNIIPGYKGIMDLDLSIIDSKYHNIVIEQHLKDIYNYKKEQSLLKSHLRYENTIERINKLHEIDHIASKKRQKLEEEIVNKRINPIITPLKN
tara:strand:+ start:597 stop:881 length:285 start_codon:yes stop_codon:yes gene_type:complete